ncbi:sugar transferase [Candidatus Saccharibacteria bacterium]|nr:sugar transferase [Candidatus Saccharibacteria bacterium]
MNRQNSQFYSFVLIIVDALVLVAAFVLAYVARVQYDPRPLLHNIYAYDYLVAFLLLIPIWLGVFALIGLYRPDTYNRRLVEWAKIGVGSFIGILLVIGWEYISEKNLFPARLVAAYALIGSFFLLVAVREMMRAIRSIMFRYGKGVRRVLLIGTSGATQDIARSIANTERSGYKVVAIAGPKKTLPDHFHGLHYTNAEAALKDIKKNRITAIIQTDLYENPVRNERILFTAQEHHIDYNFIPAENEFYSGKNTVDVFLGYPMITVYQTPLVGWGAIIKRIFDFFVSLLLIIILSPVFIILIILQKVLNPGTILYKNKRLSRFSEPVSLLKFRSMTHLKGYDFKDAAEEFRAMGREDLALEYETRRKVENDPRITPFGRFLRRTSLDELPQFFNVLKGDLSLVGPRPILPQELKQAKGRLSILHSVKSGITGLWQVSGRSQLSFDDRIELELFYAQNWTFWLDIKILFKTIRVVFSNRGAE